MRQMFNANIVAGFAQQQTPFYYYDLGLLKNTLTACNIAAAKYNFHVHFALKANCNKTILALIKDNGLGADCVSGGELIRANETGFHAQKTVFAGVGKSDSEINIALDLDIFCFNVESVQELFVINELAQAKNKTAGIAIRVNPNVDAHTHQYITTGLDENKFGINMWELPAVAEALKACKKLNFLGILFNIWSKITNCDSRIWVVVCFNSVVADSCNTLPVFSRACFL
jgi:diaminopimelate decarboxylase